MFAFKFEARVPQQPF